MEIEKINNEINDAIKTKKQQLVDLDLEIHKLELVNQELKAGILSSLWMDEPTGGFSKMVPFISIVLTIIILIVVIFK